MLEKQLSDILAANLRRFIRDLNEEQLQISLWSGGLVLRDLQLQPDILDQVALLVFQNQTGTDNVLNGKESFLFSLGDTMEDAAAAQALLLPFTVVKGNIRELVVSVPWSALDSEPVCVEVKGVELVFGPLRSRAADPEEECDRLEVMKQRHLAQFEQQRDALSGATDGAADQAQTASAAAVPGAGTGASASASASASTRAAAQTASLGKDGSKPQKTQGISLGARLASFSFVEQLVQTIVRNARVVIRDVSIAYLFDYDGLSAELAAAASVWVEEIYVTTTDEEYEDRFVVDLNLPIYKAVNLSGVRVGVHARRRPGDSAFQCLSAATAFPSSRSYESPGASAHEVPADTSASSSPTLETSIARRNRFFESWSKSEVLMSLDQLQLHLRIATQSSEVSPGNAGETEVVPPHTSIGMSLGHLFRSKVSFGSVLTLETLARSLKNGLMGAPFRAHLHYLQDSGIGSQRRDWSPARRRWAFALACVKDIVSRDYQSRSSVRRDEATQVDSTLAFCHMRRSYCSLWGRNQTVPWLPPLSTEERQTMVELEKQMTLEQIVFLRCMAYADLSVEYESQHQQQLWIESVRSKKHKKSSDAQAEKGIGRGLLGWLRRKPNNGQSATEEEATTLDAAGSAAAEAGTATSSAFNAKQQFIAHLQVEWDVGRRFLRAKDELKSSFDVNADSPLPECLPQEAGDGVRSNEPLPTEGAPSPGAECAVVSAPTAPTPKVIVRLHCRKLQLTVVPQYWDARHSSASFLSHIEQSLSVEMKNTEFFFDNVRAPQADRAGLICFVASVSAAFSGTFETPLLLSREGTQSPPTPGREDFLVFRQNSAGTARTLVVAPFAVVLRPTHELLWWGTELVEFAALLVDRLDTEVLKRFTRRRAQFRQGSACASATRGAPSRSLAARDGIEDSLSTSSAVAFNVVMRSMLFLVPLHAANLRWKGTPREGRAAIVTPLSTAESVAIQSTASTQLPARTASPRPNGDHDCGDSDDGVARGYNSYSDSDSEDMEGGTNRSYSEPSMSRTPQSSRLAMSSTRNEETMGSKLSERPTRQSNTSHHHRNRHHATSSFSADCPSKGVDDALALFTSQEGPILALSVPQVRVRSVPDAEKRGSRGGEQGPELSVVIGSENKAIRLVCETGKSHPLADQKLEIVSLSMVHVFASPAEVAVGIYGGAELTVDPFTFALLNDHVFKPTALFGPANLSATISLLNTMDEASGGAIPPSTSAAHNVACEHERRPSWRFASAKELLLPNGSVIPIPERQGRGYVTLLHRWWHTRQAVKKASQPAQHTATATTDETAPRRQPVEETSGLLGLEGMPPPTVMDMTLCIEFVRVLVRNSQQEEVIEMELMVPETMPPSTVEQREAFSVFSDIPHAVEMMVRMSSRDVSKARASGDASAPLTLSYALLSVPDVSVCSGVGKPVSSILLFHTSYDANNAECCVHLESASLIFGSELAECVETLVGVVNTVRLAPLPSSSCPSLLQRSTLSRECPTTPSSSLFPLTVRTEVTTALLQVPLCSQPDRLFSAFSVTTKSLIAEVTISSTGAVGVSVNGYISEALQLTEDAADEDLSEIMIVGPSTALRGQPEYFVYQLCGAFPSPGESSPALCSVRTEGGHVCVNMPFLMRCTEALSDPLYIRLMNLQHSTVCTYGLTLTPLPEGFPPSEATTQPAAASPPDESPAEPTAERTPSLDFSVSILSLDVLLPTDAQLPVEFNDDSTFFYLHVGQLGITEQPAPKQEAGEHSASTVGRRRRRIVVELSHLLYSPSSDRPPAPLAFTVTTIIDVGVLLSPCADLSGYKYVPGDSKDDLTVLVQFEHTTASAATTPAAAIGKNTPAVIDVVLSPSRLSALMRVVALNFMCSLPSGCGADAKAGKSSLRSTPRRPRSPECSETVGLALSALPTVIPTHHSRVNTVAAPVAEQPAVAIIVTIPSIRVRLLTDDQHVFAFRAAEGIQYYQSAGGAWSRCPAQNIQVRAISLVEEIQVPDQRAIPVLLLAVSRLGVNVLVSLDGAPVSGAPKYVRVDGQVDSTTVFSHLQAWNSLATLMQMQLDPIVRTFTKPTVKESYAHSCSSLPRSGSLSASDAYLCEDPTREAAGTARSGRSRAQQALTASVTRQVVVLTEGSFALNQTEVLLVRSNDSPPLDASGSKPAPESDSAGVVAALRVPKVTAEFQQTSSDKLKVEITMAQPPTFAARFPFFAAQHSPSLSISLQHTESLSDEEVHFLAWEPLPLELASATGYVKLHVTVDNASTQNTAVVGELMSGPVPSVQSPVEVFVSVRGLRILAHVLPCLSLANFIASDVLPDLEKAAAVRERLFASVKREELFTPQRTVPLFHANVDDFRVSLLCPQAGTDGGMDSRHAHSITCELLVNSVRLTSGVETRKVDTTRPVVASVPIKQVFVACLNMRTMVTGVHLLCGTPSIFLSHAVDASPVVFPSLLLQVSFPLPATTFMEVSGRSRSANADGTADVEVKPAEAQFVFPPPNVYADGVAVFLKQVNLTVGGALTSPSSSLLALSLLHVAHLASLSTALSSLCATHFSAGQEQRTEAGRSGADRESVAVPAANAQAAGTANATALGVELCIAAGCAFRVLDNAGGNDEQTPLCTFLMQDEFVVKYSQPCALSGSHHAQEEGTRVRHHLQATVTGRFALTDHHGTVMLSRFGAGGDAEPAGTTTAAFPTPSLSIVVDVAEGSTCVRADTWQVLLHASPALVDFGLRTLAVAESLTATLSPDAQTFSANVSEKESSLSSVEPAAFTPPSPGVCVTLHIHDIGAMVGASAHLVLRDLKLDLMDPFLHGKVTGGKQGQPVFTVAVGEVAILRDDDAVVYASAQALEVGLGTDVVRCRVRRCLLANHDLEFFGDLAESALALTGYALKRIPIAKQSDEGTTMSLTFSVNNLSVRLYLPENFSPAGGYMELSLPTVMVKHFSGSEGTSFSLDTEGGSVFGMFDAASLAENGTATLPARRWTLVSGLAAAVHYDDAVSTRAERSVSVRVGPIEVFVPLGDTLRYFSEAISLAALPFVPARRFVNAFYGRRSGAAVLLEQQALVVEYSRDTEGSVISSIHDRGNKGSTDMAAGEGEDAIPFSSTSPTVPGVRKDNPSDTLLLPSPSSLQIAFTVPLVSCQVCKGSTNAADIPSVVGRTAVCGVQLHQITAKYDLCVDVKTVLSFQISQVTSTVDGSLQDELVSATPMPSATGPSSRAAIFLRHEENCGSSATAAQPQTRARVITGRLHAFRFTLSPDLLLLLNDQLFSCIATGVARVRLAGTGVWTPGGGSVVSDSERVSYTVRGNSGGVRNGTSVFYSGDGQFRRAVEQVTPRVSLERSPDNEDVDEEATDSDGELADEVVQEGRVVDIHASLCLEKDLSLGGRNGVRLRFRKSPQFQYAARGNNVLTIKSVNHARLLLSMVELTPEGLLYAPISVDEGLTVKVEGTQVVILGPSTNDSASAQRLLESYVVLGERSLFTVPEKLVVLPQASQPGDLNGQDTANAAHTQAEESSRSGVADRVGSESLQHTSMQSTVVVTTDVDLYADMKVQMWSKDQTVAVLTEACAQYHSEQKVQFASLSSPEVTHFLDERGEITLRNARLLCDSGPITAAPATLVISVQHHKLPEDATGVGLTAVKAVLPPVHITVSMGHLSLLHTILWQLRTGSAHVESVVRVDSPLFVAATTFPASKETKDSPASPVQASGEQRFIHVPPVSPKRIHRVRSTFRGVQDARRSHSSRHAAQGSSAASCPEVEVGVTVPSIELVVTNDFFKPEVTFTAASISLVAKGQRDGSSLSCIGTATVWLSDHPTMEPPRLLLQVSPELSLNYVSLSHGIGSSVSATLACPEATVTLPILSIMRLWRYDFENFRTGTFAFKNLLGTPIILGSPSTSTAGRESLLASSSAGDGGVSSTRTTGASPSFCCLPAYSTVRPEIFHYNQTRFRVIPGDDSTLKECRENPAAVRGLLLKGAEVDLATLQKGATYRFPMLESGISPGGVMDAVMRLNEAQRVVTITSAVRVTNDLSTRSVSLPANLLSPFVVPPGKTRFVPVAALQQPFCLIVADQRSSTTAPPLVPLEFLITAFVLANGEKSMLARRSRRLGSAQRLFWNYAAFLDGGTLVVPVLLHPGVVQRPESGRRHGERQQTPERSAFDSALTDQPVPAVVNLVMRKQVALENRPRTARLLPKYEIELSVQPVASLVNLSGTELRVTLFTPAATEGDDSADDVSTRRSPAPQKGTLAHGERFDWFPRDLAETQFAPHVLLEMQLGDAELRSVGPVELSAAAAQAAKVVVFVRRHSGRSNDGSSSARRASANDHASAALVLARLSESVIAVQALAILKNDLPYTVHVRDLAYQPALVGCGSRAELAPGASHPLFLPCQGGQSANDLSADTPVSLCVAVIAGRETSPAFPTAGANPSVPFVCTAPTLSALLSCEETGCEHFFQATLSTAPVPLSTAHAPRRSLTDGGNAPVSAFSHTLTQRVISFRPMWVVHNTDATLSLVLHFPGLSEGETVVVPPNGSHELVDFGLTNVSGGGEPEVVFQFASQTRDWQFVSSPPMRLTALTVAAVPVTFKHRLSRTSMPETAPGVNSMPLNTEGPEPEIVAGRKTSRFFSCIRVPSRQGEVATTEWYAPLTLTPSTQNGQSVLSVSLDFNTPVVVENRTQHAIQYDQKLLTAVGGSLISPTSSSIKSSLSSVTQTIWGYVVEPFTDGSACGDVAALEAPAVQLTVLLSDSNKKTGLLQRGSSAASMLIDLHKVAEAKEAVKITQGVFALVTQDFRHRCFYVTVTEDKALESKLLVQPRFVAHTELFVQRLNLYLAAVCVPPEVTSLQETPYATLFHRQLLNVNFSVTPESTDAEVLTALKARELDVMLLSVSGLLCSTTWNEQRLLTNMSVAQVDVVDCTTAHPVYPVVLHMGPRRVTEKPQGAKDDSAAATVSGVPADPRKSPSPCFSLLLHARLPHISTRQTGNYYTIREAFASLDKSVSASVSAHLPRRPGQASGSRARLSTVSTKLISIPVDQLRIGFGDVVLKLHDSFMFTARQAVENALFSKDTGSTGNVLAVLEDGGDADVQESSIGFSQGSSTTVMRSPPPVSRQRKMTLVVYDCFITHLLVSSVALDVTITRRADGRCNPFEGLPLGSFAVPSIDGAPLYFRELYLRNVNRKGSSTTKMILAVLLPAYRAQAIVQSCKLLGSLEALGNPMALLGGWSRGLRSLAQGTADMDFVGGAKGFIRETSTSTLHHVGLLSRLGGRTLASLSRAKTDEDWLEYPESRGGNIFYGLGRGVTAAIGGAVTEPLAGAQSAGVRGFVSGVSKGMVGLVTKPMAGLLYSVGSAAELYAKVQATAPAELHVQYLGTGRNFMPAVITATGLSGSVTPVSSPKKSLTSPSMSPAGTPVVGGAQKIGSPLPPPSYAGSTHVRSLSASINSPASAAWRGSPTTPMDFISPQMWKRMLAKVVRHHAFRDRDAARRAMDEVGIHNFALHADFEDFWQYTTPEEFYNWFPTALVAQLGRHMQHYLTSRQEAEEEESVRMAVGAAQRGSTGASSSRCSSSSREEGAGLEDPVVERARNIKVTLGVRTLPKYVTLEQMAQVCTVQEIRETVSVEDFQKRCGLVIVRAAEQTLKRYLSLDI